MIPALPFGHQRVPAMTAGVMWSATEPVTEEAQPTKQAALRNSRAFPPMWP